MSYQYKKIEIPKLIPGVVEADVDFLIELLYHQSPSATIHENDFADWLEDYVRSNIKGAIVKKDGFGNVLITKGISELYPAVIAHMDTAQDYNRGLTIIKTNNFISGFDDIAGEQCGMGADDKCGVAFAIEMLRTHPILKVVFTMDEEIGGIGAYNLDLAFFKNCSFLIQLDRNSYKNDMIEYSNGCELMSKKFKEALLPFMAKYNYTFGTGSFTDCGVAKDEGLKISCMNVSCGYVNEHMSDEVVIINAYKNAVNLGNEIITSLAWRKWEHVPNVRPKAPVYSGGTTSKGKYGDRYYDWEDWYQDSGDGYCYTKEQGWYKEEDKHKRKKEVYHHSNHWKFEKSDEEFIQDELEIGQCPVCQAGNLTDLNEGESVCKSCDSIFNIPVGKSVYEIGEELNRLMV